MKTKSISIIIPPDDSFREINSAIPSLGVAVLSGYLRSKGYAHGIFDLARACWRDAAVWDTLEMFNDLSRVERYSAGGEDEELDAATGLLLRGVPVQDGAVYAFSMDIMPRRTKLGAMICMASHLKRRVSCTTVAGGLLYREALEELVRLGHADYAVSSLDLYSYSGHHAFFLLLEQLNSARPDPAVVPGLLYGDSGAVRVNEPSDGEPFFPPDFSGFDLDSYRTSVPERYADACEGGLLVLPYRFAAGCRCNCAYCYNSRFKESANLDADATVEQLAGIVRDTGCRHFLFLNPCFNVTKKFAAGMADALASARLGISWSDCAMFHGLDGPTLVKLSAAGCARLFFGFESLTGNIGKYVTKKLDLAHIVDVLETCRDNNIWTGLDIITGFPFETRKEVERLATFLRKYSGLIGSVTINKFMLYRHTKFHTDAAKYGIEPGRGGNILEAAGGLPFDETGGRKWAQVREDMEWGADRLKQVLESSLGYWNDAEMLPLLYGLRGRGHAGKELRAMYREMVEAYPKRRHEEEQAPAAEVKDMEEREDGGCECGMGVLGDQKDFARDIKIRVKSVKGLGCRGNHYVGQTFYVVDALTPGRLCMNALSAMMPSLSLLMFGGKMPWGEVRTLDVACPDGTTQVIFELSVIKPEDAEKERAEMLRVNEQRAKKIGAGRFARGRH